MPDDVAQALLHDAITVDRGVARDRALERGDIDVDRERRRCTDAGGHLLDRLSQAEPIEMIRPKVVRDLTDLVDRIARRCGDLVEVLARGLVVVIAARDGAEQGAIPHDQQVLPEAVVQLGGDTLPLRLLRGNQLLGEGLLMCGFAMQPGHVASIRKSGQSDYCEARCLHGTSRSASKGETQRRRA